MPRMLEEKVIVITGAGRGIGRDLALLAAQHGASVVVNDLGGTERGEGADATPAEQVVGEIERAGGKAVASYDSVASWEGARKIVQCAIDGFGQLDGVVNNAGNSTASSAHRTSSPGSRCRRAQRRRPAAMTR
ncbi:MAG TPA: SDR family NAD(P)-dependent oxidoreductase [Thermoanaerobaculia bacterium]|nr:SDR family NAD(P)-dependent oxidoreductase [Thermoanaerobaculia bacterium]